MKKFLLFSLFTLLAFSSFAQELSVEPNPANYEEENLDLSVTTLDVVNHAELTNLSDSEVVLRWRRTIVSAPSVWEFPVCDNVQCYFSGVSVSPVEVIIAAGDVSLFDVHCRPNTVAGCGTVRLDVAAWDDEDFATILYSATYEFKVNNPGVCEEIVNSIDEATISKVRVYPNPTADLFNISELQNIPEVDEVVVYNIVGKKVKSFVATAASFSVGDLPDGMYMVSLIDNETGILKTVRMSKNSLRP